MLQNVLEFHLPRLLEEVLLGIRRRMWYQHDWAPTHFAGPIRAVLTNNFGNRWIGGRGPVNWPARSPDLTPLDFFLWGYKKNQVYSSPVDSEMELIQRIHAAATLHFLKIVTKIGRLVACASFPLGHSNIKLYTILLTEHDSVVKSTVPQKCVCVCVFQCQPTALLRASGSMQGG